MHGGRERGGGPARRQTGAAAHTGDNAAPNHTQHAEYLLYQMHVPQNVSFSMLVPWVSSWISNGLFAALGRERFYEEARGGSLRRLHALADEVARLQSTGISGGAGQLPNLGNTYAGLVLLKTLGRIEEIDKAAIVAFIAEMRTDTGFTMYADGEEDIRATYCAAASFSLLFSEAIAEDAQFNPLQHPEGQRIFAGIEESVYACQTYEGGFAGAPLEEAHGGYTFCALATLRILEKPVPDAARLARWLAERQSSPLGGFSGRTEKEADSCYNFWVGACFKLAGCTDFSPGGVAAFTLSECQGSEGGIKSAPGSQPDVYHTAYALLGLHILSSSDFNCALCIPATAAE